jgi:hypothetical protein
MNSSLARLEAIRKASGHADPHLIANAQRAIRDIFSR